MGSSFPSKHGEDIRIINQLDDRKDVLLVAVRTVPQSAKPDNFEKVHTALELIEGVSRMGFRYLLSQRR